MSYVHSTASAFYMRMCRESLFLGLIGRETFLARLAALKMLSEADSAEWFLARTTLLAEQWEDDSRWGPEVHDESEQLAGAADQADSEVTWLDDDEDDDGQTILQLIPAIFTGLSAWS